MRILSKEDISKTFTDLLVEREAVDDITSLYFYHLGLLTERIDDINKNFPRDSIHAIAIKTNNLPGVLNHIVKEGCGLEAASFEEILLAINANCPVEKIVFDSPVKTLSEINHCNQCFPGLRINANSFSELERLKSCNNLVVGIRLNPMIEIDAPELFNVSGCGSKFGIPITLKRELLNCVLTNNNITGLHVHPGSEIENLKDHVNSIASVVEFAEWINSKTNNQITWIDIGGGVKAEIENNQQKSIQVIVKNLRKKCPQLFSNFKVITEYGRFIHQYCAFAVSRIEDLLEYKDSSIMLIHLGADMYLREVYSQYPPSHNFFSLNCTGQIKNNKLLTYDIGGPLCFSGDFLAKNYLLSESKIGDFIAIDQSGANSISMWSSHCSRKKPEVIYVD